VSPARSVAPQVCRFDFQILQSLNVYEMLRSWKRSGKE